MEGGTELLAESRNTYPSIHCSDQHPCCESLSTATDASVIPNSKPAAHYSEQKPVAISHLAGHTPGRMGFYDWTSAVPVPPDVASLAYRQHMQATSGSGGVRQSNSLSLIYGAGSSTDCSSLASPPSATISSGHGLNRSIERTLSATFSSREPASTISPRRPSGHVSHHHTTNQQAHAATSLNGTLANAHSADHRASLTCMGVVVAEGQARKPMGLLGEFFEYDNFVEEGGQHRDFALMGDLDLGRNFSGRGSPSLRAKGLSAEQEERQRSWEQKLASSSDEDFGQQVVPSVSTDQHLEEPLQTSPCGVNPQAAGSTVLRQHSFLESGNNVHGYHEHLHGTVGGTKHVSKGASDGATFPSARPMSEIDDGLQDGCTRSGGSQVVSHMTSIGDAADDSKLSLVGLKRLRSVGLQDPVSGNKSSGLQRNNADDYDVATYFGGCFGSESPSPAGNPRASLETEDRSWKLSVECSLESVRGSQCMGSDVIGTMDFDATGSFLATGGIARKIRVYSMEKLEAMWGEESKSLNSEGYPRRGGVDGFMDFSGVLGGTLDGDKAWGNHRHVLMSGEGQHLGNHDFKTHVRCSSMESFDDDDIDDEDEDGEMYRTTKSYRSASSKRRVMSSSDLTSFSTSRGGNWAKPNISLPSPRTDADKSASQILCTAAKLSSLKWAPQSANTIGCGDYDGVFAEWDLERGLCVTEWDEHSGQRIWSVDYSSDRFTAACAASAADDGCVKLWARSSEASISTIRPPSCAPICSVEFSKRNPNALALGSADANVYVYDIRKTSSPILSLEGHTRTVSYVRFLPNGLLASSSIDSTVKVWNVDSSPLMSAYRQRSLEHRSKTGVVHGTRVVSDPPSHSTSQAQHACAYNIAGTGRMLRSFSQHSNRRHFVGLSAFQMGESSLLASGTETNELVVYQLKDSATELNCMQQDVLFRLSFGGSMSPRPQNQTGAAAALSPDSSFVSSVCWRPLQAGQSHSNQLSLAVANSNGIVRIVKGTKDSLHC